MFEAIGKPPQPITTRWSSWLQAAFYYATNLPSVRDIGDRFEGSGRLAEWAKVSINAQSLPQDLIKINTQYKSLASLVLQMEDTKYTIWAAHNDLTKLGFGDDSCAIAAYIRKRLEKNDLSEIMAMNCQEIFPTVYGLIQHCLPTTASVECSFSMLNKLLAKNQNFLPNNVWHYMCVHYNLSTNWSDFGAFFLLDWFFHFVFLLGQ